jgi:hypothetical protein
MRARGMTFPTTNDHRRQTSFMPALSHSYPEPVVTYSPLAEGVEGTFQTLDAMRGAVMGDIPPQFSGYQDQFNLRAAQTICESSLPPAGTGDDRSQIAALFAFCRDQINYLDHPWNMQVVKDCKRTLESREGDCVSKSVCLATLLASLGHASRFVAQAPSNNDYDHVYVEVWTDGQWLALDPTADGQEGRPLADVGWRQALPAGGIETPYTIFF